MPVSAATLSLLISEGLSGDRLLNVVRSIDADLEAATRPVRTLRQERNHRYYEAHKGKPASESVLNERLKSDDKSDGKRLNSDDLRHPASPPKRYNQTPSPPLPSLRSGNSRSTDFDRFYIPFPKHVNPDAAKRKLDTILRSGVSIDDIVAGVERYAASVSGTERQFIQAPDVWLNKGRWKDGLVPNGPSLKAVTAMVWVEKDSPEGRAWWEHTRQTTGKYPPTDKQGGWHFPTQYPPAKDAAE